MSPFARGTIHGVASLRRGQQRESGPFGFLLIEELGAS